MPDKTLLDIINEVEASAGDLGYLILFVDENGEPCPIDERAGLAFTSDEEPMRDDRGGGIARVNIARRGDGFLIANMYGVNLASIPDPAKVTFRDSDDFLQSFFQFAHLWPLVFIGTVGNIVRTPFHRIYIANAFGERVEDGLAWDLSGFELYEATTEGFGPPFSVSSWSIGKTFPLIGEVTNWSGFVAFRQGRGLVITHPFDDSNVQGIAFRPIDGFYEFEADFSPWMQEYNQLGGHPFISSNILHYVNGFRVRSEGESLTGAHIERDAFLNPDSIRIWRPGSPARLFE